LSLTPLCRRLNYSFSDETLLKTALTHRSACSQNNERLEFLGDAVLNFIITGALFEEYSNADEGTLSRLRAALVKGNTLAEIALDLELGEYLKLGSGELKSGGFRRQSILADALEAVLGAVYLDGGIESTRALILRLYAERIATVRIDGDLKDPKTRLQEYLQARHLPLPDYQIIDLAGEAHDQIFTVSCSAAGLSKPTIASAGSRRKAEQAAAEQALQELGHA
jgi:ribonuclease-3